MARTIPEALVLHAKGPNAEEVFATVWSKDRGIERRLTFREFAAAVDSGAADLERLLGMVAGRVALLSKGTLDFYVAVASAMAAGRTPVLLNWLQPVETLASMLRDAGCVALGVAAPYTALGAQLGVEVRVVFALDGGDWTWTRPLAPGEYSRLEKRPDASRESEAAVFFTTGSTSRPKPVLHTHATLLWTAENFVFPTETVRTTLCFMPNFHVLMCFQNFMLPLVRGVGCSIHGADATDAITPQLLLQAAQDLAPDTIDTVPFIMNEWSTLGPDALQALSRCASVRSGGAPLSAAVATRLVDAGVRVQSHYGQTEAPGMQLLTVAGAAADELAVFAPPWAAVEIDLDGGGDEGELVLKGCRGSSPGYLKDGLLVPGSSRTDASGRHRTEDVFTQVVTKSGVRGIKFSRRVDDVILLSTGEMFNPLPMEAAMEDFCRRSPLVDVQKIRRLVILGQGHPAPFLVFESSSASSTEEVAEQLWPGIDEANAQQVSYARVKKGHVIGVSRLPLSAKNAVIRSAAERELRPTLEAAAENATHESIDWDEVRKQAQSAGFGDDVEGYLESRKADLAVLGVDSLGIASLKSRGLREAERISDNVKAWTVTCVVINHWYFPLFCEYGAAGVGALQTFYQAEVGAKYAAVSWSVQYFVTVAAFVSSVFKADGPTASVSALVFIMGYVDGVRDGPKRVVRLSRREPSLVVLIAFMKFAVFALAAYTYRIGWRPRSVYWPGPINIAWFLYSLLYYRLFTWLAQKLPVEALFNFVSRRRRRRQQQEQGTDRASAGEISAVVRGVRLVAVCVPFVLMVLTSERFAPMSFVLYNTTPTWLNVLVNMLLDDSGALVVGRENARGLTVQGTPLAFWPRRGSAFVYAYTPLNSADANMRHHMILLNEPKVWLFYGQWLVGYFYGEKLLRASLAGMRSASPARRNLVCLGLVLAAFVTNWFAGLTYVTWLARGAPNPFPKHPQRAYPRDAAPLGYWIEWTPRWIWQGGTEGRNGGLIDWQPKWARFLYVLMDASVQFLIAFFIVAACSVVKWRAARCGNAALGKYILLMTWPTGYFTWVVYLVSLLGRALGSDWLFVRILQAVILVGYPFLFVYFVGPLFTAVVILVPKFVLWLLWDLPCSATGLDDAYKFLAIAPAYLRQWLAQYSSEVVRDLTALRAAVRDLSGQLRALSVAASRRLCGSTSSTAPADKEQPNETTRLLARDSAPSPRAPTRVSRDDESRGYESLV